MNQNGRSGMRKSDSLLRQSRKKSFAPGWASSGDHENRKGKQMKRLSRMVVPLVLASFVTSVSAQEVSIPDPGLNAAIRDALQKPTGPLTVVDLLSLTNLDASDREVSSLEGL